MEVSDRIALMNKGRIEQVGRPRDLYEHPANEFVMGFIGPVNQRGAMFVRPHDLEILHVPAPEAEESMIERIVNLGFETRIEMLLADGEQIWAQMTRDDADLLELTEGQIVYTRPRRAKFFEPNGDSRTDELAAA